MQCENSQTTLTRKLIKKILSKIAGIFEIIKHFHYNRYQFKLEEDSMEDMANWNEAQKAIAEAMEDHRKMLTGQHSGPSAVTTIYHKLVEKGLLKKKYCKKQKKSHP